jgi:hypothetical protein
LLFSVLPFVSFTGSTGFVSSAVSFVLVLRAAEVDPELERWSVE